MVIIFTCIKDATTRLQLVVKICFQGSTPLKSYSLTYRGQVADQTPRFPLFVHMVTLV